MSAKKTRPDDGNRYIWRNVLLFFLILGDGQDPERNTPSTEVQIIEFLTSVNVQLIMLREARRNASWPAGKVSVNAV